MVKTCTKCGEEKALTEFNRQKGGKDGYRSRCRACTKVLNNADYHAKKEHYAVGRKKRYEASRPENVRVYGVRTVEYYRERNRQWYKDNPEYNRTKNQRRRAMEREALVHWASEPSLPVLVEFYGANCLFPGCDKTIDKKNPVTLDHIIALQNGGKHTYWNTQPLCKSHNSGKRDRHSDDYRAGLNPFGVLMDRTVTGE